MHESPKEGEQKKVTFGSVKDIFKAGVRILKYSFKEVPLFSSIFVLTTLSIALVPFLTNWFQAYLIDQLITTTENLLPVEVMLTPLLLFIGAMLLDRIIRRIRTISEQLFYFDLHKKFIYDMLEVFSRFDVELYEDPGFNDKLERVKSSYENKPATFFSDMLAIISAFVSLIAGVLILANFSIILLIIITITVFPEIINNVVHGRRKYGIWYADVELIRNYNWTASYLSRESHLQELKIYRLRKYLLSLIKKYYSSFVDKEKQAEIRRTTFDLFLTVLSLTGFAYGVWLLVQDVVGGVITIGLLTFYFGTIRNFSGSLSSMLGRISRLYENGLYLVDIFDVMDFEPKIVNGSKVLSISSTPPRIEFKKVYFKYPYTHRYMFKDFNFTLNPGENVALVGENGAGKTTLVKLLCRFYDVNKGEILIDGVNIKELDVDSWYKHISMLSQDFARYHFDAKTNIGLGDIDKVFNYKEIKKAARMSGAHSFIQKYDKGYEQGLSKRFPGGIQPSVGQWQRIALARAFYKDAPILILDEPTSAIDPKAEYEIFETIFEKFAKDKSVLIISHRFSTVRNAGRILVIDKGKIIEEGNHQALMNIDGKYAHAYRLQKKSFED